MKKIFLNISTHYPLITGLVFLIAVGIADYVTGSELRISIFYLAPIFLVTWRVSTLAGIVMAVMSACVEAIANVFAGLSYSYAFFLYWNASMEMLFFGIVVLIVSALKGAYDREKLLARKDFLTG